MGLPDLVKACDLFVYLNIKFRSFQFEEEELKVPSTFVANIHQMQAWRWLAKRAYSMLKV